MSVKRGGTMGVDTFYRTVMQRRRNDKLTQRRVIITENRLSNPPIRPCSRLIYLNKTTSNRRVYE